MLICRCAGCEALTAARRGLLDAIARVSGCPVADDLCELIERSDERLAEWAKQPHLTILACQERAVRALFAFAGAPLAADCTILDVRHMDEAELAERFGVNLAEVTPVPVRPSADGQWAPWYPVIDYARCVHCRQCLGFCLFGVYALADKNVQVANPRNCKPQCPACARVCPRSAIIFPKYPSGVISGADPDTTPPDPAEQFDISAMGQEDVLERLRKRMNGGGDE